MMAGAPLLPAHDAPLNATDPERVVSGRTKAYELEQLLPWNWKTERLAAAVDA
jgi:hypothetical protein